MGDIELPGDDPVRCGSEFCVTRTDRQALRAEYCIVGIPHNTAI